MCSAFVVICHLYAYIQRVFKKCKYCLTNELVFICKNVWTGSATYPNVFQHSSKEKNGTYTRAFKFFAANWELIETFSGIWNSTPSSLWTCFVFIFH